MRELRAIVFPEDGSWVAQCLEIDVAAYGRTKDAAAENLRDSLVSRAILDRAEGREPFEGLSPAPETFRRRFEQLLWRRKMQIEAPNVMSAAPAPWMLFALESDSLPR